MRYSFLEAKIRERGIKKKAISVAIGATPKALNNKQYIDHWSFKLDVEILLKTIAVVFTRSGAK